ncbi:hypothetical protein M501DRAFT_1006958 [Patellaria atrata CBS 101060]|uniref:CHRD domain-containing protein n=1 Tax=Patellaria atrata CBS 101060 TaxID=1346257 RepID=A0A9P4S6I5_9PEZI|nr:hypothetical protein M501DRAFT_1006958 [Patellaria atrata CBS 101060]
MHLSSTILALLTTISLIAATPQYYGHRLPFVYEFDKVIEVKAVPLEVRNGTTPVPGEPGAYGLFNFGLNIAEDTICFNITLFGVSGAYKSPALTATHIHEAARGASGPPRLAFPNPVGDDHRRVSAGCLKGPFLTGVKNMTTGIDTGEGFTIKKLAMGIEGFFADTHTEAFPVGAVRGQLDGGSC